MLHIVKICLTARYENSSSFLNEGTMIAYGMLINYNEGFRSHKCRCNQRSRSNNLKSVLQRIMRTNLSFLKGDIQ